MFDLERSHQTAKVVQPQVKQLLQCLATDAEWLGATLVRDFRIDRASGCANCGVSRWMCSISAPHCTPLPRRLESAPDY